MNSICTVKTDCNLIKIYSEQLNYAVENCVKWCSTCGAVVIDQEVDGRVYPGKIREMKFPKDFKK